ncbi:MAG: hypothetical protein K2I78_02795, partial [Clostridia bacterium]|nr:hypothetical protein [Clostridia bacterium]
MDIQKKKLSINLAIVTAVLMALMFSCVGVVFGTNKTTQANTISNIASQTTNLGEMLLDGYENDTSGKGNVFDKEIFWELVSQISGEENPTKSTLDNLTMPKTSADFRTFNGGTKDVLVQIGGKKWIATYLSTNTSGEPILTLWLASATERVAWHTQAENTDGKYPNNMYGTSSIRAFTLNNGGSYAKTYNATSLTPVEQDPDSQWAIYTMDKKDEEGNIVVKGSIKEFLEVPNNMDWQHNQSAKTSASQSSDFNNDALDSGGDSPISYLNKTGYANWANDTLWVPSIAEIGVDGESGIWKAKNTTRASDWYTNVRSAYPNYYYVYVVHHGGSGLDRATVTMADAVRPAFHLNLKLAAERAGLLGAVEPTDVSVEYTGETLTLADVSAEQKGWYNADKIDLE